MAKADDIMVRLGIDALAKQVMDETPSVLAAKIRYLEKLNGRLLTLLVKKEIITHEEAKQMVYRSRQEAG